MRGTNHDLSRPSEPLEPGRQVGRFTRDCLWVRNSFADQVAHNHLSRCDAHTCLDFYFIIEFDTGNSTDGVERSPDGTLSLIFMSLGPTKIGEDAIAQKLGDVALVSGHGAGGGVLIPPHDITKIFRIKTPRKFRRADQVAEHYGQLSAFRRDALSTLALHGACVRRLGGFVGQRSDGTKVAFCAGP